MGRYWSLSIISLILCASCEEQIDVDLNSAAPAFVVEAVIYKDSACLAHLTRTTSYFAQEAPGIISDATIRISDGDSSEQLKYSGNGYYIGNQIIGTEDKTYNIEIEQGGRIYQSTSYMPTKTEIFSVGYYKSEAHTVLNPYGKTVFTINCEFRDNPDKENFYMIRLLERDALLENYYLINDDNANKDTISFSESIFSDGGETVVQVFSIDEAVYTFFMQLNDILFWKHRVIPPSPYNPRSNVNNGALGYFSAWAYTSETINLE